jgi:SUMO ligase MMS21 Smc5/6 complex component
MLTDEDIRKIIEANREVFSTKEDFEAFKEEMKESFSDLQTSVDAYAKKADAFFQEMLMLSHKVDRHEKWILQIAEKLELKLEY